MHLRLTWEAESSTPLETKTILRDKLIKNFICTKCHGLLNGSMACICLTSSRI